MHSAASSWLGGVLHKGNAALFLFAETIGVSEGVCAFSPPAVTREVTSCEWRHHVSAVPGRGGGFLTAVAAAAERRGEKPRT